MGFLAHKVLSAFPAKLLRNFSAWDDAQSTKPHQPGLLLLILNTYGTSFIYDRVLVIGTT